MARRFTRQAFHELVWTRPMVQLAKEFAISDVALHKICRKHAIPTPPVGWWAKQAAGKSVTRTPLPPVEDEAEIVIASADLTSTDAALAHAREQARILASSGAIKSAAAMHPVTRRTLAALRDANPLPPLPPAVHASKATSVMALSAWPARWMRLPKERSQHREKIDS